MTRASKQVEWCVRKAKKEVQEGKKHRGLIQGKPNTEEAKSHITKAEHNLRAIDYFNNGGFSDWSISAGFYCIYHCFLAIGYKFGYESRNQECTIALIQSLKEEGKIDIDDKFIEALKRQGLRLRNPPTLVRGQANVILERAQEPASTPATLVAGS